MAMVDAQELKVQLSHTAEFVTPDSSEYEEEDVILV